MTDFCLDEAKEWLNQLLLDLRDEALEVGEIERAVAIDQLLLAEFAYNTLAEITYDGYDPSY